MNRKLRTLAFCAVSILALVISSSCFILDLFDPEPEWETPVITSTKVSRNIAGYWIVEIWWNWLDGSDAYELWRSEDGGSFQEIGGWTSDTYFVDYGYFLSPEGIKPGSTYSYKVGGHFEEGGFGPLSEVVSETVPAFIAPQNLIASWSGDGQSVLLNWDPVDPADGYRVYRSQSIDGSYSEIGTISESIYQDNSADPDTTYFYKVLAYSYTYFDTDYSEVVPLNPYVPSVTASWHDLGSPGFGSAEGEIDLAAAAGNLYALFADAADTETRIRVMVHDESDLGNWSAAGVYLSLSSADGDEVRSLVSGGVLYAAYADTDASIGSGGSPRISVKQYNGSAWSAVGAGDGVTTFDIGEAGAFGAEAAITSDGSGLFLVYQTDSILLVDSLSYPGSGDYWIEANSNYWTDNTLSAFEIDLFTESGGQHVAALQTGGGTSNPVVNMYRYSGTAWAVHGTGFSIGVDNGFMNINGFITDSSNAPYLAAEKLGSTGEQEESDVNRWNGSAWQNLNLSLELTDMKRIMDVAIVSNAAGTGILAAAAYQNNSDAYKVELWEYSGGIWEQIGTAVDSATGAFSVDVALDSASRPVLIFTEGLNADLRAVVFRE